MSAELLLVQPDLRLSAENMQVNTPYRIPMVILNGHATYNQGIWENTNGRIHTQLELASDLAQGLTAQGVYEVTDTTSLYGYAVGGINYFTPLLKVKCDPERKIAWRAVSSKDKQNIYLVGISEGSKETIIFSFPHVQTDPEEYNPYFRSAA